MGEWGWAADQLEEGRGLTTPELAKAERRLSWRGTRRQVTPDLTRDRPRTCPEGDLGQVTQDPAGAGLGAGLPGPARAREPGQVTPDAAGAGPRGTLAEPGQSGGLWTDYSGPGGSAGSGTEQPGPGGRGSRAYLPAPRPGPGFRRRHVPLTCGSSCPAAAPAPTGPPATPLPGPPGPPGGV